MGKVFMLNGKYDMIYQTTNITQSKYYLTYKLQLNLTYKYFISYYVRKRFVPNFLYTTRPKDYYLACVIINGFLICRCMLCWQVLLLSSLRIYSFCSKNKFNKCEGINIRCLWWITTYSLADIKISLLELLLANAPRVLYMIINDPT